MSENDKVAEALAAHEAWDFERAFELEKQIIEEEAIKQATSTVPAGEPYDPAIHR